MKKQNKMIKLGSAFFSLLCCVAFAGKAFATDRLVATTGTDTGDCSATACLTVGYAIGQAVAGDRILVAAGTYVFASVADINKQLELRGAQADVDARNRAGAESVLTGTNGVLSASADGVIINGFTIEGQTSGILNGGAVWLKDTFSAYQFINNIVQNNIFGLYANSSGTSQSLVQFNLFQNNNATGAASGNGVYSDYGSHDILIDSNQFNGQANCGIVYDSFNENNTDIEITNNQFNQNEEGVCLFATDGATVDNNDIVDSGDTGVIASVNVSNIAISNNRISNATNQAIRIGSNGGTGTQADVSILSNQLVGNGGGILMGSMGTQTNMVIHFNRIFDNDNFGLNNGSGSAVDAENNWWGCNAGPNDGPGDCDTVVGTADFDPWLILRLLADPTTVDTAASSDLLADLLQNSDGADTSAQGNIPDNTPATFTATLGSVNPAALGTTSGQAASVFTAGTTGGSSQVCTTVDNQTICTDIVIDQAIPTPSPTPIPGINLCLTGSTLLGIDGDANCGAGCSLQTASSQASGFSWLGLGIVLAGLLAFRPQLSRTGTDTAAKR